MSQRALIAVIILCSLLEMRTQAEPSPTIQFNRDVRSILSDKCFACHGPDANKREAELRLDDEQSTKKSVIVPGKPDESELLRRILSDDPDERMPPGSTEKSLTADEIATLRAWIIAGAPWQEHWSWMPPVKVTPPTVAGDSNTQQAIDRFIRAALAERGLAPSQTADRRTLIRRLSFDLTGLPPTPAEVDAFVANHSADAYDELVDRLIASEHFGERMAMYWLDVVRYADTGGYHSDNHRDVAPYRDYVINAFNDNMPFDQFTIEQLAGDLLPNPTTSQKIASGYNRLLQTTQEGGAQPKEYTAKYLADRVRNTATAWLGLTMGCCECHNHKFDQLTMKDFYSLGAFFADIQEVPVGNQPQTSFATPEQEAQLEMLSSQLAALKEEYRATTPDYAAGLGAWMRTARADVLSGRSAWQVIKPASLSSANGQTLTVQEDLSALAGGENPGKDTYTVELRPAPGTITALRLEALLDESMANKSLARGNGNFVLTEFEVELRATGAEDAKRIPIKEAIADFSQSDWPIVNAIDGKPESGWAVDGHNRRENRKAMFVLAEPVTVSEDTVVTVRLKHDSAHAHHNIGRFRLATSSESAPTIEEVAGLPDAVAAALKVEPEKRSDAEAALLDSHYRTVAPELSSVRNQIAANEQQQKAIRAAFPQTLISVSMNPRTVRILPRGNWLDDSGEVVDPDVPTSLPKIEIEDRKLARLDFARWIASRENPLTARVFVNRLWKLYFGQGLVKSLDDFGTQGNSPTHPELLDWLSIEFMDSGWDVKALTKLLVSSETYKQSSNGNPELHEIDPSNKWLARQARFRLDAEMVRDNALAVSGLLAPKIGGPSVKPYQPAGYWQHLNFPKRKWEQDKGENLYRRGLYTYWQRTFLHPSLLAFDAPSREECTVDRPRSNTPLQALALLNDPTYVEAARALASRTVRDGGNGEAERLTFAFRQVLGRAASDQEQEVLLALLKKHLSEYSAEQEAANQLLQVGELPAPDGMNHAELAAWTSVSRVILNLHETITRY
ncbi:MAG: PSD1 domain-containing protein [Planctomycetaceae bacterium]|nr:PSD1 domain-containing protein [Planctomycetales bacterium]MCB9925208.1 PSD1 domain-containing protein [Planctomycetaceae bacterium]